jgi:hypothetical protein
MAEAWLLEESDDIQPAYDDLQPLLVWILKR